MKKKGISKLTDVTINVSYWFQITKKLK